MANLHFTECLNVTRSMVTQLVIKASEDGHILNYTPEDILNLGVAPLAMLYLRHSRKYFRERMPHPDIALNVTTWHQKFLRLQHFVTRTYEYPPIFEHGYFLDGMTTTLGTIAFRTALSSGDGAYSLLAQQLQIYARALATKAMHVTRSDASLRNYLSDRQRFFTSHLKPDYDPDDYDSTDYKRYLQRLKSFTTVLKLLKPHAEFLRILLSPHLSKSFGFIDPTTRLPIIANAIPLSLKTQLVSEIPWISENIQPDYSDDTLVTEFLYGWQNTHEPNPLTQYFIGDGLQTFHVVVEGAPSRDPFTGFRFDPPHGHTSGHAFPPPHESHDGGSGSTGGPPPGGAPTAGASSSGSAPPPPPSPPPPPPPQPIIPDDTNYEPNSLLASKAAEYTELVRSKPATTLYHDHMTRFAITTETPVPVGRGQVRTMESGDADFTIQTRIRGVKTNYVVTYTRQSRKPIFNIIA